jgi:hypothetical protein
MITRNLQNTYLSALARMASPQDRRKETKRLPILQRGGAFVERQALKDASNALRELWIGPSRNRD